MRLSLGTAQFGLDYGITNAAGKVAAPTVSEILGLAQTRRITHLDTAAAYGDAEAVLADHSNALAGFQVTTKIPALTGLTPPQALTAIHESVASSAEHLGGSLNAILFHNAADLLGPEGLLFWQTLEDTASQYGIPQLGVSVYGAEDIDAILGRVTPDHVQLPINVLDQRLLLDGSLERLNALGCKVQARSVFLQGALLLQPEALPGAVRPLTPQITDLARTAAENNVQVIELCLGFLRLTGLIDSAVIGVTSAAELAAICDAFEKPIPAVPYHNFRVSDPTLIDPRFWKTTTQRRQQT